jgi:hypothetical protein
MTQKQSSISTIERPGARNKSETRLRGRWLVLVPVSQWALCAALDALAGRWIGCLFGH